MGSAGKLTGHNDVPPLHITVRAHDRAPVRVSVTGKGVRTAVWRDDAWSEEDHPRGKGGQFSSGGTAHVVASHNTETGNIVLHGVHGEREHAVKHQAETLKKQYAKADRDYDHESSGHPTTYQNAAHAKSVLSGLQQPHAQAKAVEVKGKSDGSGDLHIVAEGEHSGGVKVHAAYTSREEAEAHAERLSKAAWELNGDYRTEITQREVNAARRDFNKDKPASKQVSAEEADNQSHPEFEKFLEKRHPLDETLPHPGLKKANQFFVEQGVEHGKAGGTGVIRILQHKAGAK